MIKPHGAEALRPLLNTDESLKTEAESLPSMLLSSAAAANAVMLGGGYFTPLDGFMDITNALSVATDMKTTDGLFWPVPVLNLTDDVAAIAGHSRIALRDPNVDGQPVIAVMNVAGIETVTDEQFETLTEATFGTTDPSHPGVSVFQSQGRNCVAGTIEVLNLSYFENEFEGTFKTAVEIREEIESLGWETVVAFQTRNPMHLAHEELCRMAMERLNADGIVIHMLLGKLKAGDIPASVRDACIRKMVDVLLPGQHSAGERLRLRHAVRGTERGLAARCIPPEHGRNAFDRRTRSCRCRRLLRSLRRPGDLRVPSGRFPGDRDLRRRPHGLVEEAQSCRHDA